MGYLWLSFIVLKSLNYTAFSLGHEANKHLTLVILNHAYNEKRLPVCCIYIRKLHLTAKAMVYLV